MLALVIAAFAVLASSVAAEAASFTVNDPGDYPLATSSSTGCVSTHNTCTLRAAVQASDNSGGANAIVLPKGTYKLTIPAAGPSTTADPSTGDLDVTDSLTITGAGSGSTVIDANHVDRAFAVQDGDALSLSRLTIENGSPSVNSTGIQRGGAIFSHGALSLTGDVTLSNNSAPPGGQGGGFGGAVFVGYPPTGGSGPYPVVFTGATFTDNTAQQGGAVFLLNPDATTVTDSVFTGNTAIGSSPGRGGGGAIYDEGAHGLNIDSSSFADNYGTYAGGAIDTETNAPMSVTSSSFQSNNSVYGGAVYLHEGGGPSTRAFTGDRFSDNSADTGGAIDLQPTYPAAASLDRDEFDHNTATTTGGAVVDGSDSAAEALSSTGSSFIDNRSGSNGGALFINGGTGGWWYQPVSLTNATVSGNAAPLGAGIYFSETEPSTLTNDTIAFNSAGGGGVYGAGNVSTMNSGANGDLKSTGVMNTIVAENNGGDCDAQFGGSVDAGHNLDSDHSCFSAAGDKPGVDPLLGHPADNGGSVLTDALLPGSPAIDAGATAGCPSTDARDVPRPQGAACDIGSFEAAGAKLSLSSSAPASAVVGNPFNDTVTVTDRGPGPSTGTTVVDQLPAGATLYGVTPSQGSCTQTGSPAKVSCQLGAIDDGASATVTMVISQRKTGTVTNRSSALNDQGTTVSASATTRINAPTRAGSKPFATTAASRGAGEHRERIAGRVNAGGQPTVYFFQYGARRAYGLVTEPRRDSGGAIRVKDLLGRLEPGIRYHYRLVAINSSGASYGSDRTFRIRSHWHTRTHSHTHSHT